MPKMTIELSTDCIDILIDIAARMPHPTDREFPLEEEIALAIHTLADNYDATQPTAESAEVEPQTGISMAKAMENVLSPNVSRKLSINEFQGTTDKVEHGIAFDTIKDLYPNDALIIEACTEGADPLLKHAIEIVYNNVDAETWETKGRLIVNRTLAMLKAPPQNNG